jgi:hypothetical protein
MLDKRENENKVIISSNRVGNGETHYYGEDSANKEFKRLLREKIPKDNEIWSDGDKFVPEKFKEEPYLSIINEIKSNNTKD